MVQLHVTVGLGCLLYPSYLPASPCDRDHFGKGGRSIELQTLVFGIDSKNLLVVLS